MYAWKDKRWFIRALSGSRIMISRISGCLVNMKSVYISQPDPMNHADTFKG